MNRNEKLENMELILKAIRAGNSFGDEIAAYLKSIDKPISKSAMNLYIASLRSRKVLSAEVCRHNKKKARRYSLVPFAKLESAEQPYIPSLSPALLLLMGYTSHQPTGGVLVDNSDFRHDYTVSKVRINIGNHWGIMMENSQ